MGRGKKKPSQTIIIKTQNLQNKERILKAARAKGQVTYKCENRIHHCAANKKQTSTREIDTIFQPKKEKIKDELNFKRTCKEEKLK